MIDDFESQEIRTSGELWSQICSSLPEVQAEATPDNNTEFKDSFQPAAQVNGQANGTNNSSSSVKWEPMEDSEIYIASLGIDLLPCFPAFVCTFYDFISHLAHIVFHPSEHNIHHISLSVTFSLFLVY